MVIDGCTLYPHTRSSWFPWWKIFNIQYVYVYVYVLSLIIHQLWKIGEMYQTITLIYMTLWFFMDRFRFTEVAGYDPQQADRFLSDNGLEYKPVSTKAKSLAIS